jgi:hypothetical protein
MLERKLALREKRLLFEIFGETLPYEDQLVGRNDANWGGSKNSITMGNMPRMAKDKWAFDYGDPDSIYVGETYDFVHEMTHVWHWYHGGSNMRSGLWVWVMALASRSDYEEFYQYDLSDHSKFTNYNFEAQASIVADYWNVKRGKAPKYNRGTSKDVAAYQPFILQVRLAGPPSPDVSQTAAYANRPDSRPL